MPLLAPRPIPFQIGVLLLLAVLAGSARRELPGGISWSGRWPTSATSAEEAYRMLAKEGDPGFVSLAEVIQLQRDGSATLIDARSKEEFKAGRIPGARLLPFYEMDEMQDEALDGLTAESPIVIYCEGVGCELSFFLGRELQAQGYTSVRIFYGGYPEWKDAGLPIES